MLKLGEELTVPVETLTLAGKTVYDIDHNLRLICLDHPTLDDSGDGRPLTRGDHRSGCGFPDATQTKERWSIATQANCCAEGSIAFTGGLAMQAMQLRFDPSLPHQQERIQATDLFQECHCQHLLSFSYSAMNGQSTYGELGVGNAFALEHEALVRNLHEVQQRNRIQQSLILDQPRFSIEMETGTGKPMSTAPMMFELNKRYGMKKFVIVVPSIAIREGVLHSIGTIRNH
ncbi:MAG: DEAD/DEAH box helicase family protein [Thermomicrobiales bacterium]|nr:DEAD/DEAH box helicase family protein [Thermomicrobiales bacterium]